MNKYVILSFVLATAVCAGSKEAQDAARAELNLAQQAYEIASNNAVTPAQKLAELKAAVEAAEDKLDSLK